MIRRPPRSTPLYSSAASDVYKRQRFDGDALLAKLQVETQPAEAGSDVAWAQSGFRAQAVPEHFGSGMHFDAARPLIVAIEHGLSLIHISEPTRRTPISYAV